MPVLDALPSLEVIKGLKGILDYYYWKGIPCVRSWPRISMRNRTPASLASAQVFGLIAQGWSLTGSEVKALYHQDAADQPRTGRDIYMSGVYGHLHEASMSDFLALLTVAAESLANLEALLHALGSVDTDDLQMDVKTLPTPVHVEGEDQLFTFLGVLANQRDSVISGAGGWCDSIAVPEDQIWIVSTITARNNTNPVTRIIIANRHDGLNVTVQDEIRAFPTGDYTTWAGYTPLDYQDTIRCTFVGALAGDACRVAITGYRMTLKT